MAWRGVCYHHTQWELLFLVPCQLMQNVYFISVQDGIYELGKAHMRFTPSLSSFPSVAFEAVPMFVWLTMVLSRPFKEDLLAVPLSTPLSSRRSMVWCPWFCTRSYKVWTIAACRNHSSGAVWESRWPSWAVRPNAPSGFRGRKAILNHASALVTACP